MTICLIMLPLLLVGRGHCPTVDVSRPAVPVVAVTVDSERLLTADEFTHYISLKRALMDYWRHHPDLAQADRQTMVQDSLPLGQQIIPFSSFDYPVLVTHDTALASVFTAHQFSPADYRPVVLAILRAVNAVQMIDWGWDSPSPMTNLGRNVVLVRAHRADLEAVGIRLKARYTCPVVQLTADQLKNYIALKTALHTYWAAPSHAQLRQTATANERYPAFAGWYLVARVYDYPQLVGQDTALKAIFMAHHVTPNAYEPIQVTVFRAMMDLMEFENGIAKPPSDSTVFQQNAVTVKAYRQALEAVGVQPLSDTPVVLRDGHTTGGVGNPYGKHFYVTMMDPE